MEPRGARPLNPTAIFYAGLHDSVRLAMEEATADPTEFGPAQQRIHELDRWRGLVSMRPEAIVLQHAVNEATVGLLLLVSALYRPAFMSLRLFLELSLASIHFSANRLELAEWLKGSRDVKWSGLMDPDNGVLSTRYADAFFPELRTSVRNYNAIASKVYRELSEYVHGNQHTWGGRTDNIAFDKDLQSRWFAHFSAASTAVTYALSLRFLKDLRTEDVIAVSEIVNDCLGHLEPIRDFLGSAGK